VLVYLFQPCLTFESKGSKTAFKLKQEIKIKPCMQILDNGMSAKQLTNTLAYCANSKITVVKCFMALAQGSANSKFSEDGS
jgi:hypothetical protein